MRQQLSGSTEVVVTRDRRQVVVPLHAFPWLAIMAVALSGHGASPLPWLAILGATLTPFLTALGSTRSNSGHAEENER